MLNSVAASQTSTLTATDIAPRPIDYARAFRAIGQDLTELFPKTLAIDTDGEGFVVKGESHPNPFNRVPQGPFRRVWNYIFGARPAPESPAREPSDLAFTRLYSDEDIDRLDRFYASSRSGQLSRPDNYCLAERLRVMGGIVNSRRGNFKQLRKNGDRLSVDYWDSDGRLQTARLTTIILYRDHDWRRGARPDARRELWEGYDF